MNEFFTTLVTIFRTSTKSKKYKNKRETKWKELFSVIYNTIWNFGMDKMGDEWKEALRFVVAENNLDDGCTENWTFYCLKATTENYFPYFMSDEWNKSFPKINSTRNPVCLSNVERKWFFFWYEKFCLTWWNCGWMSVNVNKYTYLCISKRLRGKCCAKHSII